jgi:hypothetical protein
MIPSELRTLFWDTDLDTFRPATHPDYTIFRILEFGDHQAVNWMRETFSDHEIRRVLRAERRLTRKSANFWALIYGIPAEQVRALQESC